jgi:hypothetical protein
MRFWKPSPVEFILLRGEPPDGLVLNMLKALTDGIRAPFMVRAIAVSLARSTTRGGYLGVAALCLGLWLRGLRYALRSWWWRRKRCPGE